MTIQADVNITETTTTIQLADNQGRIEISTNMNTSLKKEALTFLVQEHRLTALVIDATTTAIRAHSFDAFLILTPPPTIATTKLQALFIEECKENDLPIIGVGSNVPLKKTLTKEEVLYKTTITTLLETFGYRIELPPVPSKEKPNPAKAQHRWRKEISSIKFYVTFRNTQATVLWQKRNEMLVKKGAKMMKVAPLNKDGSVGFSAKMGAKIRSDHQDKIKNYVTTEDIVLKSVNEVGLFLYFGGTNSWLEFLDADGKSIHDWTKVG